MRISMSISVLCRIECGCCGAGLCLNLAIGRQNSGCHCYDENFTRCLTSMQASVYNGHRRAGGSQNAVRWRGQLAEEEPV